ncbi:MAG: 4-hydroxythreonine-4-phosphate dehydrogenase 1 [Hyphococcus sp.]|nr:MAG: 4-hydroxythreonine-4-phosphate dehydrogenase 1 [Marinicaulis sp.]
MGEPGGVSAEITAKAWLSCQDTGPQFFVIDAPDRFRQLDVPVTEITDPGQCTEAFKASLPVLPLTKKVHSIPGAPSPDNASAVIESIERAVTLTLKGAASAVVTNPIQKSSLQSAGFRFPGHTEFLAALTQDTPMQSGRMRGPVMMIAGPELRTVPVTIHLAVKDAVRTLTPDLIFNAAMVTAQALQFDFSVKAPRIAVSGLNPHAGEAGSIGMEDGLIIEPAIDCLREAGIDARGPLPADTMFHAEARETYDVAICMLHDQALIPAKTLAFHDGVNVTLGLPIIRTSPDHGTALDIAGKNIARADSLIASLKMAEQLASSRHSAG